MLLLLSGYSIVGQSSHHHSIDIGQAVKWTCQPVSVDLQWHIG